jgi:hypothetical protein
MDKPTPDHIKRLERQIAHDQSQPVKPSEKRVKLNTTFDNAVQQLVQKRQNRSKEKNTP